MDHRISKDMISSGMIPSGEKKQEDLSRTQYGTAPSPNALADVYKKMYEKKEETLNEHHKKDADGNTIPHEDEELKEGKMPEGLKNYLMKKGKKEVKEEIDTYDIVLDHFLNEGYEREDILKVMSTVNLTEEPITAILGTIGAGLMKGAAVAGKAAMGAVKAGGTALKSGMKGVVSAAKGGISNVKSGIKGVTDAAKNVIKPKPKVTSSGGKIEQGSSNTGGNKIIDFAKREAGIKARQELSKDRQVSGTDKTKQTSAPTTNVAASADLFDIVKGQLLDEGLSEEEIKDIMLTLTPDEIMKEMNQGPSTPVSIDKVKYDPDGNKKPGLKVMPKSGATYIGKVRPKPGFKMNPNTAQLEKEEYKQFDPKKPDPKQVAAQVQLEKNKQKANDPMGVKNTNIGGRGKDLG